MSCIAYCQQHWGASIELPINNDWKVPVWCNTETPRLRTRSDPVSKAGTLRISPICLLGFGVFIKMASQNNENNILWSECLCVSLQSSPSLHFQSWFCRVQNPVRRSFAVSECDSNTETQKFSAFCFYRDVCCKCLCYSSGLESPN